ncbi:MAG TPA: hypothetical protein VGG44_10295 [Tepidisphaeraceae bacterium]|jgi:hypothetical protein
MSVALADNVSELPRFGWVLRWVGGFIIAISLGLCIGADVHREFFERWPNRLTEKYKQWDALMESGASRDRGVFLKFVGFPKNAGGFTANVYFRAVYALYPRPVVVVEPGVTINGTMQLLAGNSIEDEQALRDRGVGSIVVLRLEGMRPVIDRVKWLDE